MTPRFVLFLGIVIVLFLTSTGAALAQPDNDNREDATLVTNLPFRESVDVRDATVEPDEPVDLCVPFSHTVWYVVEVDSFTQIRVSTAGSNFDTVAAAWTEDFGLLNCNDDAEGELQAAIDFPAEAGERYFIQLGGLGFEAGDLRVEISEGFVSDQPFPTDIEEPFPTQFDQPFTPIDGRFAVSALVLGFIGLWLALAMWVYFDAIELGRPAIAWALSILLLGFLLLIPLFLYLIFRDRPPRTVAPGSGRRQYFHITSFVGLAVTYAGLFIFIGALLVGLVSEFDDRFDEAAATAIAAVAVGLPVWLYHWARARRDASSIEDDEQFAASFVVHRSYLHAVIGLYGIIAALLVMATLGGAVADLLGVGFVETEDWIGSLGALVLVLAVIAYHYWGGLLSPAYRSLSARFFGEPAEETPPPAYG